MPVPEGASIECRYQDIKPGSLICKAAAFGSGSTNEATEEICYNCSAGKIYRELGCKDISPQTFIADARLEERDLHILNLRCLRRNRRTTYDYCLSCNLVSSEATQVILNRAMGLFEASGFQSSKKFFDEARLKLLGNDPDGAITSSVSSLESTFKITLEKLGKSYPSAQQVMDLWDVTKKELLLGDEISGQVLLQIIGSCTGTVSGLGGLRNKLSDAHGKGLISGEVYESYAELALNLSATLSTFIIRRLKEKEGKES